MGLLVFSACSSSSSDKVDKLNNKAYAQHYRNLDSVRIYADSAYLLSGGYDDGRAEALNNLAFVCTMHMDYDKARKQLYDVASLTDNQVELLIADVQMMRLCQRMSKNKEFYDYREKAKVRLRRIGEEKGMLSDRLQKRMVYAESEFYIISSTYYYYVGLEQNSINELQKIDADVLMQKDTAQYLDYLYNVGAGGIITAPNKADVNQQEFDYLIRCLLLSNQMNYPFWTANSLQALSEHLMVADTRTRLIRDNLPAMKYLNLQSYPDSLIAGNLAEQSVSIFSKFGDPYQLAGSYRTLASCYFYLRDYNSSIYYLEMSLNTNHVINRAPDLVASIREQLSVSYSAMNNKSQSDYNRNIFIDLQEMTRQDRYYESRAEQYDKTATQLNWMIVAVVVVILLVIVLLWLFNHLRINSKSEEQLRQLLEPLREWQSKNTQKQRELEDKYDDINEARELNVVHILNNRKQNLENRAKISLVLSITPFIDRIIHEVNRLGDVKESDEIKQERYNYVAELTDKINDYNNVLTDWIQLRQGQLSLHVESFGLQSLFDTLSHSKMSFSLKGIELDVQKTDDKVKADKILTLFMINTLADNARKFTPQGGRITISSKSTDDYVEISVSDTGCGISPEKLSDIFDHKVYGGHGFGLMNCKGIIEKYHKISKIFNVCSLSAESEVGKGSRFYFRLPHGIVRIILLAVMTTLTVGIQANAKTDYINEASAYADSAYFSNVLGHYQQTLTYADSCRKNLNEYYKLINRNSKRLMRKYPDTSAVPAEIQWFRDSIPLNYEIIIDMRNESAVAALALHQWDLYKYNNSIYTQLFKETSADSKLGPYCVAMQKSESNKTVAIVILILLLVSIVPAYYFLYYRHRLYYRFCVEQIKIINTILLSDDSPAEKLQKIKPISTENYPLPLQNIVNQIQVALKSYIETDERQNLDIEIAEDECRKAKFEDNELHISNSVLDNCLSTLKHETMYYPSRIRQLVDASEHNLQAISEVVAYYKELYTILSLQAIRQTKNVRYHIKPVRIGDLLMTEDNIIVMCDKNMIRYLFDILKKQNGNRELTAIVALHDEKYARISIRMEGLDMTADEVHTLFTPSTTHIPYMICSQIIRDHSEFTNRRGCGIYAEKENKDIIINIILPTK